MTPLPFYHVFSDMMVCAVARVVPGGAKTSIVLDSPKLARKCRAKAGEALSSRDH